MSSISLHGKYHLTTTIRLQMSAIFNYIPAKLETCAPITLCALVLPAIFYSFSTEATITEEEINHAEGLLYNKLPVPLYAIWCAHFSTL